MLLKNRTKATYLENGNFLITYKSDGIKPTLWVHEMRTPKNLWRLIENAGQKYIFDQRLKNNPKIILCYLAANDETEFVKLCSEFLKPQSVDKFNIYNKNQSTANKGANVYDWEQERGFIFIKK